MDDEPNIGLLAKMSLEEYFDISLCYDGDSALNRLLSESFDVVLLDMALPKKSGCEVYQEYLAKRGKAVVIFFTAETAARSKTKGFEECGLIEKPFDPHKLKEQVLFWYEQLGESKKCLA